MRIYSDPIEVLDVCAPPMHLKVHEDVRARLRTDEMRSMATRFDTFWASLHQRLQCLNLEACNTDLLEEARKCVEGLYQRFDFEKQQINRMLVETHRDSTNSSGLAFTSVKRAMQEKVVDWDATFANFEQKFLPTEKDLRRLTGSQLKKLFDHTTGSVGSDSRLTSPSLAPTLEESDISEDGADTKSLLSIQDAQDGMALSTSNLEAIDFKLGDLPVGTPSSTSSFTRSLSAPTLQRPSQVSGEQSSSGLPRIIQELSESGSDTDSTICADNRSTALPQVGPSGSHSPNADSDQPPEQVHRSKGNGRKARGDARGVADLVKQFDLSPPASRPQSPKYRYDSENEFQRPLFKRGYSDYTRAMARSKKHSGTSTDPESAPASRSRSPINGTPQRLRKDVPAMLGSGSGRNVARKLLHSTMMRNRSQSYLQPKMKASTNSQLLRDLSVRGQSLPQGNQGRTVPACEDPPNLHGLLKGSLGDLRT